MKKYINIIESAYKKFRTKVYYENSLLYLKKKFYEEGINEGKIVNSVIDILNLYNNDKNKFREKINKEINILIYPKKVVEERTNTEDDNSQNIKCYVDSTMPVIDCSLEYYIIDMIVSMYLLRDIEYFKRPEKRNSYTYSINENFFKGSRLNLLNKLMFNSYSYGYSKWYNKAKMTIMEEIEKKEPVIVFKEDYKNFYFKNEISFKHKYFDDLNRDGKYFLKILKEIIEIYTKKLSLVLRNFDKKLKYCLPVGFSSSLILAELMAEEFDREILNEKSKNENFLYYGRYADDMLFIFKKEHYPDDIDCYLNCYNKFQHKLNVQKCSKSVIKDINKIQGSLKLMNTFCTSIVDFNDRMDILFDDENDKPEALDSFIKPKTFKLRRLLMDEYIGYNHIVLEKQSEKYNEIDRLINNLFCNGSCLLYHKLWIDIVKYLKVRKHKLLDNFLESARISIANIEVSPKDIENYNMKDEINRIIKEDFFDILNIAENECIIEMMSINETDDPAKIIPLYDLILKNPKQLIDYNDYKNEFRRLNGFIKNPKFHIDNSNNDLINIYIQGKRKFRKKREIKVGLLLNKISDDEIIETINDNNRHSNQKTFENLKYAFREASKNKVDYLIAHECYLPASWVDLAAYFCQKYKISFICGLQYKNYKNTCKNNICVLQYIESSPYYNVIPIIREKNNYSPHEDMHFVFNKKDVRKIDKKINYIIHTDSVDYTTFLCYELTDIAQRAKFKDKVSCVFVPVMNRDTEYFEHIINSYSRDIFSYIIQSNSAIYKGSAIYAPFNSNNKIIASGNGGENNRLIVDRVRIKALNKYKNTYFTKSAKTLNKCKKCSKLSNKCYKKFYNCANLKSKDIPHVKSPCR
ncbi:MAG: hypothetical protein IJV94_04565 [Bacilli bacterium]|nr:hypothetical protein [Bacilli bacterium]